MRQSVLHLTSDLFWILMCILGGLVSIRCNSTPVTSTKHSFTVPSTPENSQYQVFVETPAGDLNTLSFNLTRQDFDTLSASSGGLKPDYLPYPLNACFVPLWQGDTLTKIPAWLLCKRLVPGDTLSVHIIGMIEYREGGESHKEFLVVPADVEKQTVKAERFRDFIIAYDPVKFMFETWLKNRHGIGAVSQINWQDEEKSRQFLDELLN